MTDKDIDQSTPEKATHQDHRKRMRERIISHGAHTLADYELLEVVLFAVIPRRDTKPTAKALLERFKSFRQIMAADIEELIEVKGIGRDTAVFLKTMTEVNSRMAKEDAFDDAPILSSWSLVISFLQQEIGMRNTENFAALFLGSNNKLLRCEILATGTVNRVSVYPREIVKLALKCNAVSVIIAHNHPSGDITPSKQDIAMTNNICDALRTVDISLHDHLIISPTKYESFKQLGLL